MKIVHLLPAFHLQLNHHYQEYNLAKHQTQLGHDVYVITSGEHNKKIITEKRDGFSIYFLPKKFGYSDFVICRGLKEVLQQIRPDIVHAHDVTQGFQIQGAKYKKNLGYKLIIDQHKFSVTLRSSLLLYTEYMLFRRLLAQEAYKNADYITAITPASIEFVKKYHPEYTGKIDLIPLGFDQKIYFPDSKIRQTIRAQYNIKPDDVVIINTGVLSCFKKTEILIEAYKRLVPRNKFHLFIIGSGDSAKNKKYEEYLKKISANQKQIKFIKFTDEETLNTFYNISDICVWPAQPTISIVNAMSCGCVPILPDSKVTNFLLDQGHGLKYTPDDIGNLVNCIDSLADSKKLNLIRQNNIETIRSTFNYNYLSQKYIDIYRKLLSAS